MSEPEPLRWACAVIDRHGTECTAIVEGDRPELQEHLRDKHPDMYGSLFLSLSGQGPAMVTQPRRTGST